MKNKKYFLSPFILGLSMMVLFGCNNDNDDMDNDNNMEMTIEDIDGNTYNTTKIGTQVWMSSNLRTTKYNDGAEIPNETSNAFWDNGTTPAYCWYDNDEATYASKYGAIYNFYVIDTDKLCPVGWHVPTHADWTALETFLGGAEIAGGKMKEPGTANWITVNHIGENDFGFTALPTGWREPVNGTFRLKGEAGGWWSSDKADAANAYTRYIEHDSVALFTGSIVFSSGSYVRCIRD